jgi:hypothetical protein
MQEILNKSSCPAKHEPETSVRLNISANHFLSTLLPVIKAKISGIYS